MFILRIRSFDWSRLMLIGTLAIMLTIAPFTAFARGGGGTGGRSGGFGGGFGGGMRGPSGGSLGGQRSPGSFGRGYSAPAPSTPRGFSAPRYSVPRTPTAPRSSSPRSYAAPTIPRTGAGPATPRVGTPTPRGSSPSVTQGRPTQPRTGSPSTLPGINRRGSGPSTGTPPSRVPGIRQPQNQRSPGAINQGRRPTGPQGAPGAISPSTRGPQSGVRGRTPGAIGREGQRGQGRQPGHRPDQARHQWQQSWDKHRNNWSRSGNWSHNNHWNWNRSNYFYGTFFYPGFWFGFNYGYWSFNFCTNYCSYSPFYYYGYPYIYAPRVVVVDVPVYTYTQVPAYQYGGGYYLSQGAYGGLDAALSDVRSAWIDGRADLIIKHINPNDQIAIYLDNEYAYSLPGSDYIKMVQDAIGHVRTISFTFNNVERRNDGAYMATGKHDFYDIDGNQQSIDVSFTMAQQQGGWMIVAAGSTTQ